MSEHDPHNKDKGDDQDQDNTNNRREMLRAAPAAPLSSSHKRAKRPFLQFSGARHTRVGTDYQITSLPPYDAADAAAHPHAQLKKPAVPVEPEAPEDHESPPNK